MSRIEELERRVRQDPASITFGALAEEYRRAGRLDDAVAACRIGLGRHPSYVSARVTLGRALQELGQSAEARAEFEYVLSLAPDNLAAIRGLAEMHGIDAPEAPADIVSAFEPGEPDFAALDASIAAAVQADVTVPADAAITADEALAGDAGRAPEAQRATQIERLEIWLVRLDELRRAGSRDA